MSSLPIPWVEQIFERLSFTYGAKVARMWSGVDPDKLKAHWARELYGFMDHPDAFAHALGHLDPDEPPNLEQFKRLCISSPKKAAPALPGPKPDPARVADVIAQASKPIDGNGPKTWALRLLRRAECGEKIPVAHLRMARQALGENA